MSSERLFCPRRGGNKRTIAGLTAASVVIGRGDTSLRVVSEAAQICWFVCYSSSDPVPRVASIADTPVTAFSTKGSEIIIRKGVDDDMVSFISAGASQVINFQPGEGGH